MCVCVCVCARARVCYKPPPPAPSSPTQAVSPVRTCPPHSARLCNPISVRRMNERDSFLDLSTRELRCPFRSGRWVLASEGLGVSKGVYLMKVRRETQLQRNPVQQDQCPDPETHRKLQGHKGGTSCSVCHCGGRKGCRSELEGEKLARQRTGRRREPVFQPPGVRLLDRPLRFHAAGLCYEIPSLTPRELLQ